MEDIERLKKIVVPIAEKHGVARMSLFGSRARGEERPGSDYDFWIACGSFSPSAGCSVTWRTPWERGLISLLTRATTRRLCRR